MSWYAILKQYMTKSEYPKYKKDWKKNVSARPDNWNKINTIVLHLKRQNIPISRQTIIEELLDKPTNEDNLAIEYVLREMQK